MLTDNYDLMGYRISIWKLNSSYFTLSRYEYNVWTNNPIGEDKLVKTGFTYTRNGAKGAAAGFVFDTEWTQSVPEARKKERAY